LEKELLNSSQKLNDEFTNELKKVTSHNKKLQEELANWIHEVGNNAAIIKALELNLKIMAAEKHDFELILTRFY